MKNESLTACISAPIRRTGTCSHSKFLFGQGLSSAHGYKEPYLNFLGQNGKSEFEVDNEYLVGDQGQRVAYH